VGEKIRRTLYANPVAFPRFEIHRKYVGRSNLNENLVPYRAQINLYERACADKL
jgi:hypothetical protein